jgi:hypothetical protein
MMAIRTSLRASRRSYVAGEPIDLIATIRNTFDRAVHVVSEPAYIVRGAADRIDVLLAETPAENGLCYYDYLPPSLRRVGPGRAITVDITIGMPPREGALDSALGYVWREQPVSGDVTIAVTVGYLTRPFAPRTNGPWAEFIAQQTTVRPARIRVRVAE